MATPKQVKYVMYLLDKAGYSTRYMNAQFKTLGALSRERTGSVEAWVKSRTNSEIDYIIKKLKEELGNKSE